MWTKKYFIQLILSCHISLYKINLYKICSYINTDLVIRRLRRKRDGTKRGEKGQEREVIEEEKNKKIK